MTVDGDGAIGALTKEQEMTEAQTPNSRLTNAEQIDVFAAARWFGMLWNSTAKAVSPDELEWQCTTWGSGRGGGDWTQSATFVLVVKLFDLRAWRNHDGRDELVVLVPLDLFPQLVGLIRRLGEDPEEWPWLTEDDLERQIDVAAEVLGIAPSTLASDHDLLEVLRIE
jgi:hypothetical protein